MKFFKKKNKDKDGKNKEDIKDKILDMNQKKNIETISFSLAQLQQLYEISEHIPIKNIVIPTILELIKDSIIEEAHYIYNNKLEFIDVSENLLRIIGIDDMMNGYTNNFKWVTNLHKDDCYDILAKWLIFIKKMKNNMDGIFMAKYRFVVNDKITYIYGYCYPEKNELGSIKIISGKIYVIDKNSYDSIKL